MYYFSTKELHKIIKLVLQIYALPQQLAYEYWKNLFVPEKTMTFISSTKQQLTENKEVNFGRHIKIHRELSCTMYCWKDKKKQYTG